MSHTTNASGAPALFCPHNGTAHDGTLVCHWTGSPRTRGTRNIFWLCISTLGICVWSAVHPGVPHPGLSRLRRVAARVEWLLLGLLMPELLVLTALGELREAAGALRELQARGVPTRLPWWLRPRARSSSPSASSINMAMVSAVYSGSNGRRRTHPWTLTHSFYAVMGGYLSRDDWSTEPASSSDDWPTEPASSSRVSARRAATGRYSEITDVSAADLNDRSKSGGIAKLLLIWQLCVFLASCAARLRQGLPLALLEVTTISHSLCSLVALAFWWHKPHNVAKATLLNGYTAGRPWGWDFALVGALMPETSGGRVSVMDVPRAVAMLAIAVLYGLPHLLGRAVQFPSSAERALWNVATYAIISLPLILCSWLWVMQVRLPTYSKAFEKVSGGILAVVASMYAACSLFLLGESLRQVFALPEEAFREPQFARYLPRFS